MNKYVCQLSQDKQDKIIELSKQQLESLSYEVDIEEELENVLNSKVSDLTDLIEYEVLKSIIE